MSIFISGGAGYIGSHMINALLNENYEKEKVVVDDFSNSSIEVINYLRKRGDFIFYEENLLNYNAIEKIFENHNISIVIHFAAFKAVDESIKEPLKYYENNLVSLINILKVMQKYKVKKFIFSSSATVFGDPDVLPLTENSATKIPLNPYGKTKLFGEEICRDCKDINTICLRYFNPAGYILPKNLSHEKNLFPCIISLLRGEIEKLFVFGGDYEDSPDGTPIRDYVHISDIVQGHIEAIKYFEQMDLDGNNFEVFNLGTSKGYSVLEVIEEFNKVTGKKLNYEIISRRPGDAGVVFAGCDKAEEILGWRAERNLRDMVKDSINNV